MSSLKFTDLNKGDIVKVTLDNGESFIGIIIIDVHYKDDCFEDCIKCIINIDSGVEDDEITYIDRIHDTLTRLSEDDIMVELL